MEPLLDLVVSHVPPPVPQRGPGEEERLLRAPLTFSVAMVEPDPYGRASGL